MDGRKEPASNVLRLAVQHIREQANREAMRAVQKIVDAEQADRNYPETAHFDLGAMMWLLPDDEDSE